MKETRVWRMEIPTYWEAGCLAPLKEMAQYLSRTRQGLQLHKEIGCVG